MRSTKALTAASSACLLVAVALSVLLLERLVAAAWQLYKFAGYGGGNITLSLKTGWIFTSALCAIFALAFLLHRAARRRSLAGPSAVSRAAMYVAAAVMIGYWGLGMSNLNVWRP